MPEELELTIRTDVERLCEPGDRDLGTERNRAATAYVADRLRSAGLNVESLEFEVPEWRFGQAIVQAGDFDLPLHPGPFSPAAQGTGRLEVVDAADQIDHIDEPGAVILLCGAISETQFTPRGYPFYNNPDHAAILDALEAVRPLAVLAATSKSSMTGAMSPFPLIEDAGFSVPSAYLGVEQGARLAELAGEAVTVFIDSGVLPSVGYQPRGRRRGNGHDRVIVSAHIDSKPETPGAIDNAAGVAVLLGIADLLRDVHLDLTVEYVPFNGEDHVLAPGELAWLATAGELSDVRLAINIDAPGLAGGPSAYSLYGVDDQTRAAIAKAAAGYPDVTEGPQWPASDHMIFAMRGVPAVAVTSEDFATASGAYSHTPADVPSILDYGLLAATSRFIAEVIAAL